MHDSMKPNPGRTGGVRVVVSDDSTEEEEDDDVIVEQEYPHPNLDVNSIDEEWDDHRSNGMDHDGGHEIPLDGIREDISDLEDDENDEDVDEDDESSNGVVRVGGGFFHSGPSSSSTVMGHTHILEQRIVGSKYQKADPLERELEKKHCCNCLPLRSGLLLINGILIFDSLAQLFATLVYFDSQNVIAISYSIILFLIGLIGFIGIFKNNAILVKIYMYLCLTVIALQCLASIYFIGDSIYRDGWKNHIVSSLIVIALCGGLSAFWFILIKLSNVYHSVLTTFVDFNED